MKYPYLHRQKIAVLLILICLLAIVTYAATEDTYRHEDEDHTEEPVNEQHFRAIASNRHLVKVVFAIIIKAGKAMRHLPVRVARSFRGNAKGGFVTIGSLRFSGSTAIVE